MPSRIERLCADKGLKMTEQRRVIARVLSDAADHPDVEQVYRRATRSIRVSSIATVYRTVRLFEEANILERHDFGDGRVALRGDAETHHDHLIDLQTRPRDRVPNEEIEELQRNDRRASSATSWSAIVSSSTPCRRQTPTAGQKGQADGDGRAAPWFCTTSTAGRSPSVARRIARGAPGRKRRRDRRGAGAALPRLLRGDGGRARRRRWQRARRDFDRFDEYCDHLLVIDHGAATAAAARWSAPIG